MIRIVFSLVFIFCIALSVYGILLAQRKRTQFESNSFYESLFYQQILITVFGFYGIWGHLFSKLLLQNEIGNINALEKISSTISIMAIPFLLASWFFLIKMGTELLKLKRKFLVSVLVLVGTSIASFGFLYWGTDDLPSLNFSIVWFLAESVLVSLLFSLTVLFHREVRSDFKNRLLFIIVWLGLISLISLSVYWFNWHDVVKGAFILLCFFSNFWLSIAFGYLLDVGIKKEDLEKSFAMFCQKFSISKREQDIVELICEGYPNKVIAEKLFITIQTVKDHTSRIYLKTEVKNRTQLAHLVNEYKQQ